MCHFYVSYPNTSSCKFLFFCILDLLTHDISFIPIPVFLKSYVLKELEVFLGQMNSGGCLKMSYFGTNCVLNIHANTGIKKSASISEMTILYAQQYIHIDLRGIIWHILSLFTVCTVVHYCKTDLATQKVVDIVSVASIVHNTK